MKRNKFGWTVAMVAVVLLGTVAGTAQAADVTFNKASANGATELWHLDANWSTGLEPVNLQFVKVRDDANGNTNIDIDIGAAGVNLPGSFVEFAGRKTTIVSIDGGGGGSFTADKIKANQAAGFWPTFEVPVVVNEFESIRARIDAGLTSDLLKVNNGAIELNSACTIGEIILNANEQARNWHVDTDSPLTVKAGGTGNTAINYGVYRSTVAGGVMPGVVTIAPQADAGGYRGGSGLVMVRQTTMPTMINVNGAGAGLVIDDASADVPNSLPGLIYTGGSKNVTFANDSAFQDKTTLVAANQYDSTAGSGPLAADLGGNLLWWAVDKTTTKNSVYTLTTNSNDATSPYKGFALGLWSDNQNGVRATLQMANGNLGNMQVQMSLLSGNYATMTNDDMTFKHAPGGSKTVDLWMLAGTKPKNMNGQAISNGETNLIDTFHFHATYPGMRLAQNGGNLAGQTWIFDGGYHAIHNPGSQYKGHLHYKQGASLIWNSGQMTNEAGLKLTFDVGSALQLKNQTNLELLDAAKIDFADGAMLGFGVDIDTDAIGANLAAVIAKAEIRTSGTRRFNGSGLVIAPGHSLGGHSPGNGDSNIYGTVKSTTGNDLIIASFGREFRLYGTFDAGTNDLVAGSATPLWTSESFSANNNASRADYENSFEIPDGRVDIRDTSTIIAGGLNIQSGNVRLWKDLNLARLNIRSGANLSFFGNDGGTGIQVTVTDTLSGAGSWNAGAEVILAGGATAAPGDSVGTLSGSQLEFQPNTTYSFDLSDSGNDLIDISGNLTLGAFTLDLVDAGFTGTLTGNTYEVFQYDGSLTAAGAGGQLTAVTFTSSFFDPAGGVLTDDGSSIWLSGLTGGSLSGLVWDNGAADGKWETPANWNPEFEPGGASLCTIGTGAVVLLDQTGEKAAGLELTDAALTIAPTGVLAVSQDVDVSGPSTLTVDGSLTAGGDVTSSGTLQVDGTLSASIVESDGTLGGSGTITITGAAVDDGVYVNGVVSPGSSTGKLSVDNSFIKLSASAEYVCQLNGGDTGAFDSDVISAFDQVTVAGKLSLSALKSYGTIGLKTPTIAESTDWGFPDGIAGSFADVPAVDSHLGHGVFFRSLPAAQVGLTAVLQAEVFQAIAGDAGGDQAFNFADLVQIFGASGAVYGNPAPPAPTPDWTGGDFTGDDAFTFADLVKAFGDAGAHYGAAQYPTAALAAPDGGAVELVYDPTTGQLSIDAGDTELIALSIESSAGLLQITPQAEGLLDGFADVANSGQFAKLDLSGMSSLDFGQALAAMLSESDLLADLTVTGALVGGGTIQDVSLNVVPEPGTLVILISGLFGLALVWWRRRN